MPEPHISLTSGEIAVKLLIVFSLVLANAFFVASEFALVSVRRTRIDQLAAEGSASALAVQRALSHINRYIAATQVGVTIASLVLGGLGEQIFEALFSPLLGWLPFNHATRVGIAIGLSYLVMTTMHVVLGELLPKSFALQKAEPLAMFVVRPLTLFVRLCAPLVWALNGMGGALLRLMGLSNTSGEHEQVHSAGELGQLFRQSHEGGELSKTESEILNRVLRFSDLTAREVMVPRVEMQGIPLEMTRGELAALVRGRPHTRTPVYNGSMDDVVGIVHLKDLVRFEADLEVEDCNKPNGETSESPVRLMPLVRETLRVPETVTIDKMLVEFKKRRQQMAIVIDEYGGTAGLITMGDLLEQAFGDVHDEFDTPEPGIATRADGRIQLPGRTLIDEVNERFGLGFRDDESDTIAGLILDVLGRPAIVGDEVEINRASLRVEEVERLRIMQVSLQLPPSDDDENET